MMAVRAVFGTQAIRGAALCFIRRNSTQPFNSVGHVEAGPPSSGEAAIDFRAHSGSVADRMKAWTTEVFGGQLILRDLPTPRVHRADQVLIRIKAASVNPIDVRMTEGYGDQLLSAWRRVESTGWDPFSIIQSLLPPQLRAQQARSESGWSQSARSDRLPLVTGRDCSGEVVEVGAQVRGYLPGDEVIAVIPSTWPGSHAEYVLTSRDALAPKPRHVSHVEAASMPYTACTAWNALVTVARLNPSNARENRVLIHGGSGGIGVTAIQLLRAWGAPKVVATCSAKNVELVRGIGAIPVNYASVEEAKEKIIVEGPYEVVLDCVDSELSRWSDAIMGTWRNCVHVSLVSPLLRDTDRYGLPMGVASTLVKQFLRGAPSTQQGKWFSYSFFLPNTECLEQLSSLMEQQKVKAVIDKTYSFSELPEAYKKVGQSHASGKTVIDFDKSGSESIV